MLLAALLLVASAALGAPADFELELDRSGCIGNCPVYRLTIDADGRVTFDGLSNTSLIGVHRRALTVPELDRVVRAVRQIDFFALRDYKDGHICRELRTCGPTYTIRVRMNGREKTVHHYAGCTGFDVEHDLIAFEDGIDELAGIVPWRAFDARLAVRRTAVDEYADGCRHGEDCEGAAEELALRALVLFDGGTKFLRVDRDGSMRLKKYDGDRLRDFGGTLTPGELQRIHDAVPAWQRLPNKRPIYPQMILCRDGELIPIDEVPDTDADVLMRIINDDKRWTPRD